jgi:hypothetical protein
MDMGYRVLVLAAYLTARAAIMRGYKGDRRFRVSHNP